MGKKSNKEDISADKKENVNKKSKKKVLIFLLIILFIACCGVSSYFMFFRDKDVTVVVDRHKVIANKVIFKLSKDKKSLDNSIYEIVGYYKYSYDDNDMSIGAPKKCSSDDYKYCYEMIYDKNTTFNFYSNSENKIEKIKYKSVKEEPGDDFDEFFRFLVQDLDTQELYDAMRELYDINYLILSPGISVVRSNLKLDWISSYEPNMLEITITFVDYDEEAYKQTDEYKEQKKRNIIYNTERDAQKRAKDAATNTAKFVSSEYNDETGLIHINFETAISDYTKVYCAEHTKILANHVKEVEYIDSISVRCFNDDSSFTVRIDDIKNVDEKNVESKMSFYDSKGNRQNTTLDILKQNEIKEYKNSCSKLNYKDVLRNPEHFEGKDAYWFGEVVQVVGTGDYRVNVNCTKYHYISGYSCPDTIYVTYSGDTRLIEDDMIKIYGKMDGTKTYTTVLGASVTVPRVNAKYIDLK